MNPEPAMLQAEALTLAHGLDGPVMENVSLRLEQGQTLAVVGPSGCGKTTLLYALSGLTHPRAGRVLLRGRPVERPCRDISIILQDFGLLPWRTVLQNVALGLKIQGVGKQEREERARAQLADLGIVGRDEDFPAALSGGEQQRVAIARAFVTSPSVLLLDEPFSSLDALTREKLQQALLVAWSGRRTPYLLVTHSLEEAVFLGGRILVLAGRPARAAAWFDNPGFGTPGHRDSDEYFRLLRELRRTVERLW
ncbi:ABC transporter ATP-binding protein [Paucidesulfovibrio longus]|uniref:ABC transporter ATP-binding protein n=1 Tax=Paucidesulfovibrio longus TaxID=889 RepID=UPI001F3D9F59|nr:ABC transporter ATP-binding protein [Paucidesulfovibrio longus]